MASFRRAIFALSLTFLLVASSAWSFTMAPATWQTAGPGWATGPVWYIMTTAEYRAYRGLRSEPTRRAFIRDFWSRRDPIPESPENELESAFWERVRTADARFGYEVKPGWKTVRGKVFILLGPPDNTEEDSLLADRYAVSRWEYDLRGTPATLRLAINDSLGIRGDHPVVRFRLREEPEGTRQVGNQSAYSSSVLRPTDLIPLAEALVQRSKGKRDVLRDLGEAMRVPEVIDHRGARVHVSSVFSHIPVEGRVDYRPGTSSDSPRPTIVAVTVAVDWGELQRAGLTAFDPASALLTGRLTRLDGDRRSYPLSGAFGPDPDPAPVAGGASARRFAFQAVTSVPPGSYALDVSWQETSDRLMGALRETIDVPALTGSGFSAGSLVLAERLDRLHLGDEEPAGDRLSPFVQGEYRIIPRTRSLFTPGEPLTLFFAVEGAQRVDGDPRLELSLQFYVEDGPTWLPVGSALNSRDYRESAMAWQIPLAGWGAGRYRAEVQVTDLVSGEALVRGAVFEVAPGPSAPASLAAAAPLPD